MTPRLLPESSVLAVRHLPENNPDEWPIFDLADVNVFTTQPDSPTPTSLLHAATQNPVRVTGRLRPVPKHLAHTLLTPPSSRPPTIEIPDVRIFSYGAYADGSIGLWAGGRAGWFSLTPSAAYLPLYNEDTEAVKALYFIADSYATPRRRAIGKKTATRSEYTAQELFEKYAAEAMHEGATAGEAAQRLYQHRLFLMSSMMSGKEGMMWGRNPLYVHLRKKFPNDWELVRERLAAPSAGEPSLPDPVSTLVRRPSIDSASTTSSLKRKRGKPSKNQPTDAISISSSSAASSAARDGAESGKPGKNAKSSKAKAPVHSSSQSRTTRRRTFSDLETGLASPEVQEPQQRGSTREDSDTDSVPRPRKGKSALRLKPNKPTKGPPRSSKPTVAEDEVEEDDLPPRSSPALAGKRKHSAFTVKSRQSIKPDLDEGISMATSPSSNSQLDPDPLSLEEDTVAGASYSDLAIRLNHTLDPIQEDTWICALAGCTHKVYAASLPESQRLIRQHYALHACDDDERVKLVKGLQAPSLPVGRLIERVRLQVKEDGFPGSRVAGTRFPEPLRKKM